MGSLGNSNGSLSNLDISRQVNKQSNLPAGHSSSHLASQGGDATSQKSRQNDFGLLFGKANEQSGIQVRTMPEGHKPLDKFTYFVENQKILSNKIFYVDAQRRDLVESLKEL